VRLTGTRAHSAATAAAAEIALRYLSSVLIFFVFGGRKKIHIPLFHGAGGDNNDE